MTDFEIRPLCEAIGAEVLGVRPTANPCAPDVAKAIEQAWHDHVIVLVRDQDLTLDQQHAYAASFGKVAVRLQATATNSSRATNQQRRHA